MRRRKEGSGRFRLKDPPNEGGSRLEAGMKEQIRHKHKRCRPQEYVFGPYVRRNLTAKVLVDAD